jgi:FG-GAP repeat
VAFAKTQVERLRMGLLVLSLAFGIALTDGVSSAAAEGTQFPPVPGEHLYFGRSLSISADGRTALVGMIESAAIYTRTGSGWRLSQVLEPLESEGSPDFGYAVSLSANGKVAIVSGPVNGAGAGKVGVGAAWIFKLVEGVWVQQGQKLTPTVGEGEEPFFGASVALSANGSVAVVGAPSGKNNTGSVWVFTGNGHEWGGGVTFEGLAPEEAFGRSVALSGDGNTLLVGDEGYERDSGSAWVYDRESVFWRGVAKLVPSEPEINTDFGGAVGLSEDGETAVLGGRYGSLVFVGHGSAWVQQGPELKPREATNEDPVSSVAVSADGSRLLIGDLFDDGYQGAAFSFARSNGTWHQTEAKLSLSQGEGETFGSAVALSADGQTGLIGASGRSSKVGAVWQFGPAPTCADASAETSMGVGVKVELQCSAPAESGASYVIVEGPSHGSLGEVSGVVEYLPQAGFSGVDSFTYEMVNDWGESTIATATVLVGGDSGGGGAGGGGSGGGGTSGGGGGSPKPHGSALVAVGSFTPLLLLRAAIGKKGLGELVGVAGIRGVADGATVLLRCVAGCAHRLEVRIPVGRAVDARRRHMVAPLVLGRATELEVAVSQPGRVTRFARYRFVRRAGSLRVLVASTGCRIANSRRAVCP